MPMVVTFTVKMTKKTYIMLISIYLNISSNLSIIKEVRSLNFSHLHTFASITELLLAKRKESADE